MGLQAGKTILGNILSKTRFMDVARSATKGNIVAKNMEISGKKAIKFMDKTLGFETIMHSIKPENARVVYSTKGYNGSSVTGFRIFDGETEVAKGVLGLDKTKGKHPFVQLRGTVGANGNASRFNILYNGNAQFNGSVANTSNLNGELLNFSVDYGKVAHIDGVENTTLIDSFIKKVKTPHDEGEKLIERERGFLGEIPTMTAQQFKSFKAKIDAKVKELVGGRKKLSPEDKLQIQKQKQFRKEHREYLRKRREEIIARFNDEKSAIENAKNQARKDIIRSHSPEIQETKQKVAILEQQLKDITAKLQITATPDEFKEVEKTQREIKKTAKALISKVENEIKPITEKYDAQIKELAEQKKKDLETFRIRPKRKTKISKSKVESKETNTTPPQTKSNAKEVELVTNQERLNKFYESEGLFDNVPQYPNQNTINLLKKINGTTEEQIFQIKEILLNEKGINPNSIQIRAANSLAENLQTTTTQLMFMPASGSVIYNKEIIQNLTKIELTGVIAHELDHAEKFVKLAKSLGFDKYKQLVFEFAKKSKPDLTKNEFEQVFDTNTWKNLIKQDVNLEGFNTAKYLNATQNYNLPKGGSYYETIKSAAEYRQNPFEESAYATQASITQALGKLDITNLGDVNLSKVFNQEFERILKNKPKNFDMSTFIENILNEYRTSIDGKIDTADYVQGLLNILRKQA